MSSTREDENRRNFLIRSCGGAASVAGLAVWFACTAAAQVSPTPATHLEVLTATIDLNTHNLKIELRNQSSKVVTAYMLEIKQFDAAKNLIGEPENLGMDGVAYDPVTGGSRETDWIQPGAVVTVPIGTGTQPETVSASVSVTGVVYADRTFEGPEAKVGPFFIGRENDAREARAAIAVMKPYPATPEAVHAALENLRAMNHQIGLGGFANGIHLSGATASVLFDKRQPIPSEIGVPSKQQWDDITAELTKQAAFLDAQSQEVRP